jgi:hypothetical protein
MRSTTRRRSDEEDRQAARSKVDGLIETTQQAIAAAEGEMGNVTPAVADLMTAKLKLDVPGRAKMPLLRR